MIQRSPPPFDPFVFEPGAKATMQEQIYVRIRDAIADGRLTFGERLPSTRSLAAQLNVARGTIDAAFSRLAAEGYIVGRGAAGTVVATHLNADARPRPVEPRRATPWPTDSTDHLWPFRGGLPALDLFPRDLWARLAARAARRLDAAALAYVEPQGRLHLREAIAAYLLVSRGVDCEPSQVFVTSGYQAALNHTIGLLLRPDDEVWLEDPGYRFARLALSGAPVTLAPIPVDAAGLDVDYARRRHPAARLAIVTPGHQSPLGVSLSLQRRRALLDWASDAGAWILEDDYDSEFHYVGHKPPALKSIDRRDRVFYAGSFSKTLFPGLRLGYLIVPAGWADAARDAFERWDRGRSALEQAVVATFLAEGHFARHLRRMRISYAERRTALAQALQRRFGDQIRLTLPEGGLTFLARFPGGEPDTQLVDRARAHGLAPAALSSHAILHDAGSALLLGFTNIKPDQASEAAERLHRAIADGLGRL